MHAPWLLVAGLWNGLYGIDLIDIGLYPYELLPAPPRLHVLRPRLVGLWRLKSGVDPIGLGLPQLRLDASIEGFPLLRLQLIGLWPFTPGLERFGTGSCEHWIADVLEEPHVNGQLSFGLWMCLHRLLLVGVRSYQPGLHHAFAQPLAPGLQLVRLWGQHVGVTTVCFGPSELRTCFVVAKSCILGLILISLWHGLLRVLAFCVGPQHLWKLHVLAKLPACGPDSFRIWSVMLGPFLIALRHGEPWFSAPVTKLLVDGSFFIGLRHDVARLPDVGFGSFAP